MEQENQEQEFTTHIYGLRTTANREEQVMDFVSSNADKKKYKVYAIIRAHGMRGYIFLEAESRQDAEQAAFNIPYARGILPKEIDYKEIEHMLETVKVEMNIRKSDIVEIISGPFKREQAKVTRIDKVKEEVVVELLEAAVPIPITVKMDAVKVIRRDSDEEEEPEEEEGPLTIPSPKSEERPIEFAGDAEGGLPMPGSNTTAKKEEENKDQEENDIDDDLAEALEEADSEIEPMKKTEEEPESETKSEEDDSSAKSENEEQKEEKSE